MKVNKSIVFFLLGCSFPYLNTVNPRISPLGAYLFLAFFRWGLIRRGGLYEGGAYKIFEDKLHSNNKFQSKSQG